MKTPDHAPQRKAMRAAELGVIPPAFRAMSQVTLTDYYSRRAHEYERIYHKPEREADLARVEGDLRSADKSGWGGHG